MTHGERRSPFHTMTETEINEAIAEAIGARFFTEDGGAFWHFVTKDGREFGPPTRDLNAMHEAEKAMTLHSQWSDYRRWLFNSISATARERAETFLRVMGRWRDE